jgi:hypothetical protein
VVRTGRFWVFSGRTRKQKHWKQQYSTYVHSFTSCWSMKHLPRFVSFRWQNQVHSCQYVSSHRRPMQRISIALLKSKHRLKWRKYRMQHQLVRRNWKRIAVDNLWSPFLQEIYQSISNYIL